MTMKIFYAMLGATMLGATAAFVRSSAPAVRRMSTTAAYVTPAEFAKAEIDANDVVVFSKTYCPFCTSTKQLLSSMNIDAKIHELYVVLSL